MSETLLNNRYRLVSQQGSGGMAVIYRAVDQELGRTVAVKVLRPSLTHDPEFLQRFKDEARRVANLPHPNIVTIHDVGNDGQMHYIVMEFVDGSDLKKLIRRDGGLPVDVAVDLSIQICAGIGFAHRNGLVHADIKPQNILLTSDRQVKVTDFGIAQALSDTVHGERQDVVWGSPHYFAPEQARGERPSASSDVYSIGIVMFELLTGQLPYTGADQQELALAHIRNAIPRVSDFAPHVPEALVNIVYKVMSKAPSDRYRMGDQLGQVLMTYRDRARQQTVPSQRPVMPPPSAQPTVAPPAFPPIAGSPGATPAGNAQAPRPLYVDVSRPQQGEPTQRYSLAPDAPSSGGQRPSANTPPAVPPPQQKQLTGATRAMPPSDTHSLRERPTASVAAAEPSGVDVVTIILAVLALISVACLFPVYYLVYQAYFG
ncbi:MAG: protein kinase domain-containing protein [Phototrophicaceae bacterium]